jgi:hypothetical protein
MPATTSSRNITRRDRVVLLAGIGVAVNLPSAAQAGTPRRLVQPAPLGQVHRRRPGPFHPADPVDQLPVIPRPATLFALLRQQRF